MTISCRRRLALYIDCNKFQQSKRIQVSYVKQKLFNTYLKNRMDNMIAKSFHLEKKKLTLMI